MTIFSFVIYILQKSFREKNTNAKQSTKMIVFEYFTRLCFTRSAVCRCVFFRFKRGDDGYVYIFV